MKVNVHAGHNPDGKVACGAVGLMKESTEARKVTKEIVKLLKEKGHTVYDCTVDDGISQGNVLSRIVAKCNSHSVDLDVSIHFNAFKLDKKSDCKTKGTEVCIYSEKSKAKPYANAIVKAISNLGFKNRGIIIRDGLYFLKHTRAPALLVECCFVDDIDDVSLYDYKRMAKAIVSGILQ